MDEEEIIFRIEVPQESITSIENLTKANKELREERKKLNLETADGQRRAQEINKTLDANTNIIKANSSALEKQRLNVGNYTGALDKLVPGLGATAAGFQGMAASAKAFIATPIGIVIGALGLALGALIAYFKGSEEGQTKLNKIMNIGSAVIGKFSDLVQLLGKLLFENLAKGFESVIGFLEKWVPGFKQATEALEDFLNLNTASKISSLEEQQVLLNRQLIVQRDLLKAEIEQAKLRAESTKDAKLRRAALDEVEKKVNQLADQELKLATLERDILIEKAKLANNTIADNDAIAQSEARINQVERERSAQLKENATKILAIKEAERIEIEKQRDAIVAANEAEIKREADNIIAFAAAEERHQRELEQINERIQAYISEEEVLRRRISALDLENDLVDESADANQDLEKELKKIAAARALEARNTEFASQAVLQSGQIALQVAGESKELSTAIALISTYFAAQKAFESQFLPVPDPSSPIRGGIAAAIAIASGLARVAQINKVGFDEGGIVGFASGGLSGTKIMGHHGRHIRRSNGDNMLATVRTGEVILNERQQAMLGGSNTFRRIGVPGFATGGLVTGNVARQSEEASSQMQIFDAIAKLRPIVTVEDINLGQQRVDVVEQMAKVL